MTSVLRAAPASPRVNAEVHISVCICTHRRPELLGRLLEALRRQEGDRRFTWSIVVADNDPTESARAVVAAFADRTSIPVRYCVEPRRNIARARNKAVEHATGNFVAFIDDDEEPFPDWLSRLVEASEHYEADGVLGPIVPRFLVHPPHWIVRGKLFDRPSHPTGTWLHWKQTRTGNTLLRRGIFDDPANWFRPECQDGGEDVDFFRRTMAQGLRFVWCAEARVTEAVPAERCRRTYLLRRAWRRGRAPHNQGWPVVMSLAAAPAYALALPLLALFGQHVFMRYLIKECDHLGRIVAFVGGNGRRRPLP